MLRLIRRILGLETTEAPLSREITAAIDFDDPNQRTGAALYLILNRQFDLLGKPEGEFPFTAPFSTDKARGALLGTAIAISQQQYGKIENKAIIDASITAFSLAYGQENGRRYALAALQECSDGNEDLNFAADWATKDAARTMSENSLTSPAAFYLAVAGMI